MLANTRASWGSIAKTFHWTIAILIVLEIPVGYLMSYTYGLAYRDKNALPLHNFFSQVHHTNGLLILLLGILRLGWSLHGPRPQALTGETQLRRRASVIVHAALYVILFVLPLSGWAALSVYGVAPIWIFSLRGVVPPILPTLPFNAPLGYGFFAHIHVWSLFVGGALLSTHIGGALWGHWRLRNELLVRMWPLGGAADDPIRPPAP
jgi:cytochrome b561